MVVIMKRDFTQEQLQRAIGAMEEEIGRAHV